MPSSTQQHTNARVTRSDRGQNLKHEKHTNYRQATGTGVLRCKGCLREVRHCRCVSAPTKFVRFHWPHSTIPASTEHTVDHGETIPNPDWLYSTSLFKWNSAQSGAWHIHFDPTETATTVQISMLRSQTTQNSTIDTFLHSQSHMCTRIRRPQTNLFVICSKSHQKNETSASRGLFSFFFVYFL